MSVHDAIGTFDAAVLPGASWKPDHRIPKRRQKQTLLREPHRIL